MPSTRKKTTKDGREFYEIRVSRGRGKTYLSKRWYVPDGWSKKAIDRELARQAAEFEREVQAGEVTSRAEQKALELQQAAEAAKIQTLRQYGELVYMPSLTVRSSENTRSTYQGNLNNWIYPALGDQKMPDITPASISALLLSMQEQGKAQSTCIKVYTILHSLFKKAYMEDVIPKNPMDKVARPRPRKDEVQGEEVESYTVEDIQMLMGALETEPLKWRAYIRLLIDTGIRRGEACGIQWQDLDFTRNTILICRNLCYTPKKGVYLDTPKSGKTRSVDADPEVMSLLQELRASQQLISPFVFSQENGEPMHPQSPTRYMKKLSERCNLPHLHPHILRHSFASIAITNGADVASVSEKLGHSDKAVTLRMYTHADEESMKRASNVFRDAIKRA